MVHTTLLIQATIASILLCSGQGPPEATIWTVIDHLTVYQKEEKYSPTGNETTTMNLFANQRIVLVRKSRILHQSQIFNHSSILVLISDQHRLLKNFRILFKILE